MGEPINALFRMMSNQSIKGQSITKHKESQQRQREIMKNVYRFGMRIQSKRGIPEYIYKTVMHQHCNCSVTLIYSELISHYEWLHDVFRKESDDNSEDKLLDIVNICIYFSRCDGISFLMDQEFKKSECLSFMKDMEVLAKLGWNSMLTMVWKEVLPQWFDMDFIESALNGDSERRWDIEFGDKNVSMELIEKM